MRKLTAVLICLAIPSWGVVSFNNANTIQCSGTSVGCAGNPANVLTQNMTVTAGGTNTCAFAEVGYDAGVGLTISGVTYGGKTMTSAGTASTVNTGGGAFEQIFYLCSSGGLPTGSNSLVITGSSGVTEIYGNLVSFNNVNQTTPVRAGTYVNTGLTPANASPMVITVTSNLNDETLTSINGVATDGSCATGTNQTDTSGTCNGVLGGDGDYSATPATSVTHNWSFNVGAGGGGGWAWVGFSIDGDGSASIAPCSAPFCGVLGQ